MPRGYSIVGGISVPVFLGLGVYSAIAAIRGSSWGHITTFVPKAVGPISFGMAVTMVIAQFVDSGTMTPDFTRWAKTSRDAVIATLSAFPFANFIAMFFGAIVVASAMSTSGDFSMMIAKESEIGAIVAMVFLVLNSASVCSHCLYNAATGWAQLTRRKFRWMSLLLGLIGTAAAAAGMWSFFINWLNILGIIVPGIGGTVIAHFIVYRLRNETNSISAFSGWLSGAIVGFIVNQIGGVCSSAVCAMLTSILVYCAVALLAKQSVKKQVEEGVSS